LTNKGSGQKKFIAGSDISETESHWLVFDITYGNNKTDQPHIES